MRFPLVPASLQRFTLRFSAQGDVPNGHRACNARAKRMGFERLGSSSMFVGESPGTSAIPAVASGVQPSCEVKFLMASFLPVP